MGIINVTPDSFSDGGRFGSPEKAVKQGIRMAEEGRTSSTSGASPPAPDRIRFQMKRSCGRVIPVIRELAGRIDLPLSIDTMKAAVAGRLWRKGAEIVNDVSAIRFDSPMAKVVADARAAVELMHMRG